MAFAANAKDWQVYNNGDVAPGLEVQNWWEGDFNLSAQNPMDASAKAFLMNGVKQNSCMGIMTTDVNLLGSLHSATLHFSFYGEGAAAYTIRLTGPESNYNFEVTAENAGKWNTVEVPIAETFPALAESWNTAENNQGHVFSVVVATPGENAKVYFDNIYYSGLDEAWVAPEKPELPAPTTVPVPTQDAADVISIFGTGYTPAVTFNIGGWGQSTQVERQNIDGREVYLLNKFNYLGLVDFNVNVSEMTHMHVDMWTADGEAFGFVPISLNPTKDNPGWVAPEVKKEEWNSYDVPLSWFVEKAGVNLSAIEQIKFDQGNGGTYYLGNVYFYKDGNQQPEQPEQPEQPVTGNTFEGSVRSSVTQDMGGDSGEKTYDYTLNYAITYNEDKTLTVKAGYVYGGTGAPVGAEAFSYVLFNGVGETTLNRAADSAWETGTSALTFEAGQELTLHFKKPMALGAMEDDVVYKVGEKNISDGVTASASDANAPVEYYNLQGVRVSNPENGLFIRVQGGKSVKVVL